MAQIITKVLLNLFINLIISQKSIATLAKPITLWKKDKGYNHTAVPMLNLSVRLGGTLIHNTNTVHEIVLSVRPLL